MNRISIGRLAPLVLAALVLAACDKNPAGLKNDPAVSNPFSALAAGGSSVPQGITDLGKLIPHNIIPGFPDLGATCASGGSVVMGVAFNASFIYVAHGGYVNSCITRYNAATGAYIDQKIFRPDSRGLWWVPALGMLVARTYGGPLGNQDNPAEYGRFFTIDYPAGTATLLTNYDAQPCDAQGQPAVDPNGFGYWINCGTTIEHHRMSDGALVGPPAITVAPFFTLTHPMGNTNNEVFTYTGGANNFSVWDKATGTFLGTATTASSNGCSGYGLGDRETAAGVLVGINLDCTNVRIESFANGSSHGPLTSYPGTQVTGHIKLCKDASSPPGSYGYAITSSGTVAGDVVQMAATLSPGQCRIVFSRTAFSLAMVTLQITEVAAGGTVVHTITRTQFGTTTVFSGPSPTITVQANSAHAGVVTYKNIAGAPIG